MLLLLPVESQARKLSFIRDAEIEATIRAYADPLLEVAKLEAAAVRILIVKDTGLNAFVSGGQNIFVNTGLLMKTTDASQIIGVLAHEIGHIEGGHLSRLANAKKKAGKEALIGSILGGAAAVLGNPAAGTAIAAGGAHIGTRSLLQFNRTQESAADQAALRYLEATGQSAQGLADFLNMLVDQELLSTSSQDPYVRTHPLSRQRIDLINNHLAKSRYRNVPTTKAFGILHNRMRAKLAAFLQPPVRTLRQYPKKINRLKRATPEPSPITNGLNWTERCQLLMDSSKIIQTIRFSTNSEARCYLKMVGSRAPSRPTNGRRYCFRHQLF